MIIVGRDVIVKCIIFLTIIISPLLVMYPVHAATAAGDFNILGVDSTTFPNIKVNLFVPCSGSEEAAWL